MLWHYWIGGGKDISPIGEGKGPSALGGKSYLPPKHLSARDGVQHWKWCNTGNGAQH